MFDFRRLWNYALGYFLSLLPVMFGGFVIYEKTLLAVLRGQTEERAGIVERAVEPASFWMYVVTYGVCGSLVAFLGLCMFWQILKTWRSTKDDPSNDA